jgi:dnd system-associated protein 4
MPTIRIPEAAKPFLAMCRRHEASVAETEQVCFETYADLIVFAAALGFDVMGGRIPTRDTRFVTQPNPIDFQIFKDDRRYPQILLIALAASRDRAVIREEELLCRITEDFAAVGCERLKELVNASTPGSWHLVIAKRLAEGCEDPDQI